MLKSIWAKILITLAVFPVLGGEFRDARLDLKLSGGGGDTALLRRAFADGVREIYFPEGRYRLGTLDLPQGARLRFAAGAKILPDPAEYRELSGYRPVAGRAAQKHRMLFAAAGDDIGIENLTLGEEFYRANEQSGNPLTTVFYARGRKNLTVSGWDCRGVGNPARRHDDNYNVNVAELEQCENVVVENSRFVNIKHAVWTLFCTNVSVRGNRAEKCRTLTTFGFGSRGLRHYDNWSSQVQYQCVFRGGLPSPSRRTGKPHWVQDSIPFGSSGVFLRGLPPGIGLDEAKKQLSQLGLERVLLEDQSNLFYLYGVYDIQITGNYAEYGTTLCWGNKGRQVIISGNIARFMWDYSYGTEGCDAVVISGNISINSAVAGVMCMYFSENHQITDNLIIVRHEEPFDPGLAEGRSAGNYFGHFMRFHHGPMNDRDTAAGSYYGAGGMNICNNLMVNELTDRPSGIAIEAGRDIRLSGNKIINGFLLARAERSYLPKEKLHDAAANDEFAARKASRDDGLIELIRQGNDRSRVTVSGNEFISRQPGEKPQIVIESLLGFCAIRENTIRREPQPIRFTPSQREREREQPRLMLYTSGRIPPDPNCRTPEAAIWIAPANPGRIYILNNLIDDYRQAIGTDSRNIGETVVSGNITAGTVSSRLRQLVRTAE